MNWRESTPGDAADASLAKREFIFAIQGHHVYALEGSRRRLVHGRVVPNLPGDIERMPKLAEKWRIAAWRTYTQADPAADSGWWLDDAEHGGRLIDMARKTGVRTICIHKGLPLPTACMTSRNRGCGSCRDVGRAAHVMGKLFRYLGENNVLWGTDSIW